MSECAITAQGDGVGGLSTDILQNSGVGERQQNLRDVRLISRAVRDGWGVPAGKRKAVINRMVGLVEKTVCTIMTAVGPVAVEAPADQLAVAASKVLVDIDKVDQTDYWNNDKNERLDSGKATERMSVMPQITLRGIADGDCDVLPVSEDGVTGGNGVALPPVDNREVAGE